MLKTHDFYYDLPEELIAQTPLERRDASRLMTLDRKTGEITHRHFYDLPEYLRPGDCLILNNSRVLPARLLGHRVPGGGACEILLLIDKGDNVWECLVRPGKKLRKGARVSFGDGELTAEIVDELPDGNRLVRFEYQGIFLEVLERLGKMPLPPYIKEELRDSERYQTVYSKVNGSAAAPTAGLHFTPELLERVQSIGVKVGYVTLHVGLGTFRPVKEEEITDHDMHSEYCVIPQETADLINEVKAGAELGGIVRVGLVLVLLAMISLVCGGAAGFTGSKAASGFAKNVRHDLFTKVQSFSFENIDKFSSASLVTRMTTDIQNMQMAYMMCIRIAVRAPLMMIFSIIMAFIMGGRLALTFVVIVPVLVVGLFFIAREAMPAFRAVFRKYDKLNESVEENVRAMRVVKGFAREGYEKQKFAAASHDIAKDFTFAERVVALNAPLMQFCVYFNMIFVLFVGSRIIITNGGTTIDVGQLSAMLTYGMQILMSLMMISMIYVMMTMSYESFVRICEVLEEEPALTDPASPAMDVKDGSIDFENVSFKYSAQAKKFALQDINLHIDSGMTVGILGGTGSSKSTLVQLIPRLYDVSEGCVKVGGRDVREYDLEVLRGAVSVVLQKNVLFSGTIKDNLRWGNENATDDEMIEACRLAQADEFVRSFPDGYDTYIEQGGSNVSGGQKQRLCIARALLKKPKILILDDSTSAVDTRTDALIREGFRTYIPETTKIIIAQRVASVQDADLILVMDNGHIADMGTHDQLLASSEIYREVYESQTNGGEQDEA